MKDKLLARRATEVAAQNLAQISKKSVELGLDSDQSGDLFQIMLEANRRWQDLLSENADPLGDQSQKAVPIRS